MGPLSGYIVTALRWHLGIIRRTVAEMWLTVVTLAVVGGFAALLLYLGIPQDLVDGARP